MQAGDPAQPVQQSVVIARIRGFFFRVAFPSPTDMGQYLSTMSYKPSLPARLISDPESDSNIALLISSTICVGYRFGLKQYRHKGLNGANPTKGDQPWKQ